MPVAVNSTDFLLNSLFSGNVTVLDCKTLFSTLVALSLLSVTFTLTGKSVVSAVIIMRAAGAKTNIHTKSPISATPAPIPINNFLRKLSKFGTFDFFTLEGATDFLAGGVPSSSKLISSKSSLSAAFFFESVCFEDLAVFSCSPTGKSEPSIMSLSSIASAGISGISGLLCKFLATGMPVTPASLNNAASFVIKTNCFPCFAAFLFSNLKFTSL